MQNSPLSRYLSSFFIFLFFCFLLHSCPFAVLTIENNYCHNTKTNEILQFM